MASSAVSIDSWSDSEIRTKLAELGTPVGPVTETTRKILIKKLKRLLQLQGNNAASPGKQRRSLVRYSSGEDSQGEETNMPPPTSKIRNLRRKTTGSAELLSAFADSSVNTDLSGQNTERTTRGSRKSLGNASAQKIGESFDTDSDSDISLTYTSRLRKSRRSETTVPGRLSPKSGRDASQGTKPESLNNLKKSTGVTSDRLSGLKSSHLREDEEDTEEEEEEEEEIQKPPIFQSDFLSRLSSGGTFSSRYRSSSSPKPQIKPVTPYVSTFTNLGSAGSRSDNRSFSTRQQINSFTARTSEYADRDDYSSFLNRRQTASVSHTSPKVTKSSIFARYKISMKWFLVCGGLLILLLAIYFLLFANFNARVYLASIDSDENKYPICGQDGVDSKICVQELKPALDISRIFIPRVLDLTTKAYCDPSAAHDSVGNTVISEEDALNYLATKMPKVSHPQLVKNLRNFKILVLSNPHWEIEVVTKGLTDINDILFNGDFAARRVNLPIGCYLRLMTYSLIKIIIVGAFLVGSVLAALFGVKLYKRHQEQHKQEVYSMVNQILSLLSAHNEQNSIPGFLAVDNCRDELIQPIERDRKKRVWDNAVEFLEKNESRVRTEVHCVRGENVKVWRWLPAGGPPLSPSSSMDSSSGPILGRLL